MAEQRRGYENAGVPDATAAAGGHAGSSVKQGMHGGSRRAAARGRDEFNGNGASAAMDMGRTETAGRHYGRSGPESPGPGYGRGPLQPAEGTRALPVNDGVNFDEIRTPDAGEAPERSQGRHGENAYAQGRDAGRRKQMLPEDRRAVARHEDPGRDSTAP